MTKFYTAWGLTKAGVGTLLYNGNSRGAAKTAAKSASDAGTYSKAVLLSNSFFGVQIAGKNPAGT
jgi:hypothetical protein